MDSIKMDAHKDFEYITLMLEEKSKNPINYCSFTRQQLESIARELLQRTGAPYSVDFLRRKYHRLRNDWKLYQDLCEHNTGIGWDPVTGAILASEQQWETWISDCVGAIDGTHISAFALAHRREAFRNRHGTISQNVLAACDHDMCFVYIRSAWEGSTNDARVFLDAVTREGSRFPMPPQGKYYVVDSAYRNTPGFLASYRGFRYHLQDFRGRDRGPRGAKELFNHRHSSIRNVIERAFGVLKVRFPLLRGPMPKYMIARQALIVIACAIVHNFIRDEALTDVYFAQHEYEEMIVEDDSDPQLSGLSHEYDTSSSAVGEWNEFRDSIATQIWNASRNNN